MKYQFYWIESNTVQVKLLIPHTIWEEYNSMPQLTEAQVKRAKSFLKYHTKGQEWFTDKSPMFEAIETGILNCNGIYPCKITQL